MIIEKPDAVTSARMRNVKQRNTNVELRLRKWMWKRGYRYVIHNRKLPGSPDISNSRRRWAIFVHGCFWHGHGCLRGRLPKKNRSFWVAKIEGNRQRDLAKERALRGVGFAVYVVWECQLAELTSANLPDDLSFRLPDLPRPAESVAP